MGLKRTQVSLLDHRSNESAVDDKICWCFLVRQSNKSSTQLVGCITDAIVSKSDVCVELKPSQEGIFISMEV